MKKEAHPNASTIFNGVMVNAIANARMRVIEGPAQVIEYQLPFAIPQELITALNSTSPTKLPVTPVEPNEAKPAPTKIR